MDVMPDCAPEIVGHINRDEPRPDRSKRRWRAKSNFTTEQLKEHRGEIRGRAPGQNVETFVADEWTLEYDLTYAGLAQEVWVAAHLAAADTRIVAGKIKCILRGT
jgi:putative ATP-dependent endonuclease of OLD family